LLIITILLMICALLFTHFVPDTDYKFKAWSLLPPLVAILLAFVTRQVFLSLFLGVYIGSAMLVQGNIFGKLFHGYIDTFSTVIESVSDKFHAGILIFTLAIGGMIGVIAKMGGTRAIALALADKAKTARSAQLYTMLMGVAVFFDDYANTLIVGPTMRPLTDAKRVSREKLSYIVDSTAAPVAGMALISTWVGYELGLINDALKVVNIDANSYGIFLKSIPFRFYDILALVLVFLVGYLMRDFGPMLTAERRARKTGKVLADGAIPMSSLEIEEAESSKEIKLKVSNALVPILTMIVISFIGLWYSGGGPKLPFSLAGMRDAFGAADASVALLWGAALGSIVAIVMATTQKILTLQEAFEAWVNGTKSLIITCIILSFAWSLGSITKNVGTANYLVSVITSALPGGLLPVFVFVISCIVSFATGTSWGTMAIMMPLAVPLANAYTPGVVGHLLLTTIGAILTGAIFGDHCSPISDTTIMSSMASSADHIDHVRTQMPYALVVAGVAVVLGYLPGGFGLNPFISLLLGAAALYAIVRFIGKSTDEETLAPAPETSSGKS
jgi:Na+/H+ antiporter NhaC